MDMSEVSYLELNSKIVNQTQIPLVPSALPRGTLTIINRPSLLSVNIFFLICSPIISSSSCVTLEKQGLLGTPWLFLSSDSARCNHSLMRETLAKFHCSFIARRQWWVWDKTQATAKELG